MRMNDYREVRGVVWMLVVCMIFAPLFLRGQTNAKTYTSCNHDSLVSVLRAYEDTLALSTASPPVRWDYAWRATDIAVTGKVYLVYRCEALFDSLRVRLNEVAVARATPPVVDTDSIGGISGAGAVVYGKVIFDGDTAITEQWFRLGRSLGSLTDSVPVVGVATPFSTVISSLSSGTTYYVAAFAKNIKGISSGDTLSFITHALPTIDTELATSVTSGTATLHATILSTGGATVTAAGFKYASNSALSSPVDVPVSTTIGAFSGAVTGLLSSTQYWAVGYATNSEGTSYGDTISFTTGVGPCAIPTVTYAGYTYQTVQIGPQCWFQENLRTEQYRDGTPIPANLTNVDWVASTTGARSVQDEGGPNESTNVAIYGRLYNWHAVNNSAALCPSGWHVPTDAEWTDLETYLGGSATAGTAMKDSLPGWNGLNSSGFTALAGGNRGNGTGILANFGTIGFFWSSTQASGPNAWVRYLTTGYAGTNRAELHVRGGFSVRCLKD